MMSKNSFLVSMKENNKRRLWVWVISLLAFVLVFPTYTALTINRIISRSGWIMETYSSEIAQQILHERLRSGMQSTLGFSVLVMVITTGIALISAVQGFSYLYSRKKIDFYMGMPVKRKKRFLTIWVNGILLYVIPYFLGLLISMLIAAGNGGVDRTVVYHAVTAFYVNFIFYLGVYHMAILAVMLTGNIMVTGFGFLVFCLYEYLVRVMFTGYQSLFFQYFSSYGTDTTPLLSPFGMYINLYAAFNERNMMDFKYLTGLAVFAAVVGIIAYICYLKRPGEAAGKAMTFEITKPFVKILLIVPAALVAGLIIAEVVNFDPDSSMKGIGYMIFAITLVVVIGSALIQVIYEFDIKGALHKKSHIVVCGILSAIVFIVFRYDLTGYDRYIPKQKDIESIAFVPDYYEMSGGGTHFDSDGSGLSLIQYGDKYMELKNLEEICELIQISMDDYKEFVYRVNEEGYKEDQQEYWSYATIIYHLKNGHSINRAIWINVNDERTTRLLDQIMGSWEFKKGYMAGASENLDKILADTNENRKIEAAYGNSIYNQKINKEDAGSFLEVYRKDLALADFSNIKNSTPVGVFSLTVEEQWGSASAAIYGLSGSSRWWTTDINIYPFYDESIAWLKANGYYMDYQLDIDDVDHIQVMNRNSEARLKMEEKIDTTVGTSAIGTDPAAEVYGEESVDTRVYADYDQKEDIARIASCVCPEELWQVNWDGREKVENDYQIIVYFKAGSETNRSYGPSAYYCFIKDQVPDFVMEDTLYR